MLDLWVRSCDKLTVTVLMIQEEFALGIGQHHFGQFRIWAGIVLKSGRSQKEMMMLGQQKCVPLKKTHER